MSIPLGAIRTLDIELDIIFSIVDFISSCADVIGLTVVILAVGITGFEVISASTVLVATIFSWTVLVRAIFS